MSYLARLEGKKVLNTEMGISTAYPMSDTSAQENSQRTELELRLLFDEYSLSIYNRIVLIPSNIEFSDLRGLLVINTFEKENQLAELCFDNGIRLQIDLSPDAYYGPEAMYLDGPDDFWVVWT